MQVTDIEGHADRKASVYDGSKDPKRAAFYDKIYQHDMIPLWEVMKDIVAKEPKTAAVPAIWLSFPKIPSGLDWHRRAES